MTLHNFVRLLRAIFARPLLTAQNLPQIFSAVAQPIAWLIIVFLLRNSIRSLIARLVSATWGDKAIKFGEEKLSQRPGRFRRFLAEVSGKKEVIALAKAAEHEVEPVEAPAPAGGEDIDTSKFANIYWLGSDLMNGFDVLLRGANRDVIVHNLRQANHHIKMVGLDGDPLQTRLQRLYDEALKTLEADWDYNRRVAVANELASVKGEFGRRIEGLQSDFQGFPK